VSESSVRVYNVRVSERVRDGHRPVRILFLNFFVSLKTGPEEYHFIISDAEQITQPLTLTHSRTHSFTHSLTHHHSSPPYHLLLIRLLVHLHYYVLVQMSTHSFRDCWE
jgi:hypothetical protein